MVSKEEIEQIAKLMRIDLDDHTIHIDRVQKMIEYFDILESAGVESEELDVQVSTIDNLREDIHIPYEDKLIKHLNNYKGRYVRAPKMV